MRILSFDKSEKLGKITNIYVPGSKIVDYFIDSGDRIMLMTTIDGFIFSFAFGRNE